MLELEVHEARQGVRFKFEISEFRRYSLQTHPQVFLWSLLRPGVSDGACLMFCAAFELFLFLPRMLVEFNAMQ